MYLTGCERRCEFVGERQLAQILIAVAGLQEELRRRREDVLEAISERSVAGKTKTYSNRQPLPSRANSWTNSRPVSLNLELILVLKRFAGRTAVCSDLFHNASRMQKCVEPKRTMVADLPRYM